MPKIQHYIHAEIDISKPVPELCGIIANVLQAWPGKEKEILTKLQGEIQSHLDAIDKPKGVAADEPVRKSTRTREGKGHL